MTQIKISDIIIPKYRPLFNNREVKHIILTSGRAGTKSSFAAIRGIYQLISDKNASVVVLRKHHNKLRKTVYKEMLRGINRLGISKNRFTITKSPMEITYKKYRTTMYFSGSDGIDDTKGIIDEDKPIKLVILDELTEFFEDGEGEDELSNIEATFIRGNKGGFQMLYLFNPPKNPNAPIIKWLEKMEKRPDCIHVHTDYRDVPADWLRKDLLETASAMEAIDPKMYRWVWLGLCVGVDEVIYYMVSEGRHIVAPKQTHYSYIGVGIDYGQQNATVYEPFGVDPYNAQMQGLAAEYYYSGRDTGKQKSPSDYAKDCIEMLEKLADMYSCSRFYLFIDPSAKGLAEEIKRASKDSALNVFIRDAENDVALGISRVQKLLSYGCLTTSPEQKEALREFGTYEYDKKSIERGKEVPLKEDDHCMDAMRYCVMGLWSKVKHFLPMAERPDKNYTGPVYDDEDESL